MFSFSKGRCDGLAWSESIALLMEAEMGFLAGRREKRGLGMARVDVPSAVGIDETRGLRWSERSRTEDEGGGQEQETERTGWCGGGRVCVVLHGWLRRGLCELVVLGAASARRVVA